MLNVHDVDRSLACYRDLLGPEPPAPPDRPGPFFLRAGVATPDLSALIVLVPSPRTPPAFAPPRTISVDDPDGNEVALIAPA